MYRESDNIPLNIWLLFQMYDKFFVMIGKQCFYSSMQKNNNESPSVMTPKHLQNPFSKI